MNSDQVFALILIFFFGGIMPFALAFAYPVLRARLKRIDIEASQVPQLMDELDGLRGRVGELEERLEFTERLLAQSREAGQLPGGDR